jgi:hypothetical protein
MGGVLHDIYRRLQDIDPAEIGIKKSGTLPLFFA